MKNVILTNMDGCTAAAYVAYGLSEVATIYPITPIASMGESADKWGLAGIKNVFGGIMEVKEMESELGAAGATHGALAGGALATTFTASQGLMLMIPNMYKIAGEQLPGVFHVGCRSLASHALSIFGDHQDVMECRATGFVMLASSTVQETMDLALAAHLAAIEGSLPILHFFDGWRTSNETSSIQKISYEDMAGLVNMEKVAQFRNKALNPEHPSLRGTSQGPDVYFQFREAVNPYYDAMPGIMQSVMDRIKVLTGREYHLVDYHGEPDAEYVIVTMGSSAKVVEDAVDHMNAQGKKTGVVNVHLYRPFPYEQFIASLPKTVKGVAALDRTKEPGSFGEPLYLDVAASIKESGRDIKVIGGRYGLSSKEFNPAMAIAVFKELSSDNPRRQFTVGIDDDVTGLSLKFTEDESFPAPAGMVESIFYGFGSDGTVGATKQVANLITDVTGKYIQAYFNYSAKKSGGYTLSQLRMADAPVNVEYEISVADYLGCHKSSYVKRFDMISKIKEGGIFVLNSPWDLEAMQKELPDKMKRGIASRKLKFYNIDANAIAEKYGLGVRINMIMATVYLYLLKDRIPFEEALAALKKEITETYIHEGQNVVTNNLNAIDEAVGALKEVDYPENWSELADEVAAVEKDLPEFVEKIARPCLKLEGNALPVSMFNPDGDLPMGTTAYEKRKVALKIPKWTSSKCVECTLCSIGCAHAAIRPYLLDSDEVKNAPAGLALADTHLPELKGLKYRIQVFPADCMGCGACVVTCPGHALEMVPIDTVFEEEEKMWDYVYNNVSLKEDLLPRASVQGSQFMQPLMQFSGACAGCGETPYVKLLTQLFGERMIVANATGCSSIWGASFPSNPYCTNKEGKGPAWGNSLFEDNAEYGYGMACAVTARRIRLKELLTAKAASGTQSKEFVDAVNEWTQGYSDAVKSVQAGKKLVALADKIADKELSDLILRNADIFGKKSVWAIGGDGWAYDIGFAGLDHVLAQNVDINILVMDTECYSNTGGQMSKATPLSAVMKYAADGKRTYKKDLGRMMMTYGNVYVASIALGANYAQAIKALEEAEAYEGPSIVIAYCPCINHGIHAGMSHSVLEEKLAVKAGYWPLYRFNPEKDNPLSVDAAAPDGTLLTFINGEDRYDDLKMKDPKEAAILQPKLNERCDDIYSILLKESKS